MKKRQNRRNPSIISSAPKMTPQNTMHTGQTLDIRATTLAEKRWADKEANYADIIRLVL